jgi:hypothetical protein
MMKSKPFKIPDLSKKKGVIVIEDSTKKCSICLENKKLDQFYSRRAYSKNKGNYTYYYPECKKCTKARSSKWIEENPDSRKKIQKKYNNKPQSKKDNILHQRRSAARGRRKDWWQNNKDKLKQYSLNREMKRHDISLEEWDACRLYFNYRCAYCDKTYEQQFTQHKKDLSKDHFDNLGRNDLSNCIPACTNCNSSKKIHNAIEWYCEDNEHFSIERYNKIKKWLDIDVYKFKT